MHFPAQYQKSFPKVAIDQSDYLQLFYVSRKYDMIQQSN